jgi:hypothetical protein
MLLLLDFVKFPDWLNGLVMLRDTCVFALYAEKRSGRLFKRSGVLLADPRRSHSDPCEAVNRARKSSKRLCQCHTQPCKTRGALAYALTKVILFRKSVMISLRRFVVSILPGPVHSALRTWRRWFFRFKLRARGWVAFSLWLVFQCAGHRKRAVIICR